MAKDFQPSPYWGNKGRFSQLGQKLWEKLVPRSGDADTTHGELLRIARRIEHEHYNNGRGNMMDSYGMGPSQYAEEFPMFFFARLNRLAPAAHLLGFTNLEADCKEFFHVPECTNGDPESEDAKFEEAFDVISDDVMERVVEVAIVYAANKEGLEGEVKAVLANDKVKAEPS